MNKAEELYVQQQLAVIRWNEAMQQHALLGSLMVSTGGRSMPDCPIMNAGRVKHKLCYAPDIEAARRYKRNAARAFHNAVRVAQIPKDVIIRAAAECSPL